MYPGSSVNRVIPAQIGFTLLELLVSLAVMGVLTVMGYTALNRIMDHLAHTEHEIHDWQTLNSSFELVADGLRHADRISGEASAVALVRGGSQQTHHIASAAWEVTDEGGSEKLIDAKTLGFAYLDRNQAWWPQWQDASVPMAVRVEVETHAGKFRREVVLR